MNEIIMYGADWCGDCRRAKAFLEEHGIEFDYRDVEADEDAVKAVERANRGKKVIPTFEILGEFYTNPDNPTLASVLGVNSFGRVEFYGADWCPDCRRAKAFLNDHRVRYQYIDIDMDEREWAAELLESVNGGKRTIPTIFINGQPHANPDNPTLLNLLGLTDEEEPVRCYDVIIIGAGAAGLTTAIYLQRFRKDTLVLEKKNIGGNAFLTAKIDNYPGFVDVSGPDLMDRMSNQAETYGATIKQGVDVTRLSRDAELFRVDTNSGTFEAKAVVVATGSHYERLGIPKEEELVGAGVHFCATCDAPFYKGKRLIVVGAGDSALEEGIYLADFADHVTFVANKPEFTASPTFTEKLATLSNTASLFNKESVEFVTHEDGKFRGLRVRDMISGTEEIVEADGAFIFIGLSPNTDFLEGWVDLDDRGFIDVESGTVVTSQPGVFAAGDCRKGSISQVAAATGEGVFASYAARHYLSRI